MVRQFLRAFLAAALYWASSTSYAKADSGFIIVQSTTSTQNSGLYDHLLPTFRQATDIEVRVVAVGTGQAIRNARNGDGDVLLVHAREAEEQFVAEGYGVERFDLMYNDFVLVGPKSDPAGIKGYADVSAAFSTIASGEHIFASRGDDSGTHRKEQALWRGARVDPVAASGRWYRETGSGMGATLNVAVGIGAYTLTDRATWTKFGNKGEHVILVEADDRLFNQYGVILVNQAVHPNVKAELGQTFIDWLLSSEGQEAIADYKVDGEALFVPNAIAGN